MSVGAKVDHGDSLEAFDHHHGLPKAAANVLPTATTVYEERPLLRTIRNAHARVERHDAASSSRPRYWSSSNQAIAALNVLDVPARHHLLEVLGESVVLSVVGHHALHGDALFGEPCDRVGEEAGAGCALLVGVYLDERQPGVVADRDVELVVAELAPATGGAVAAATDAPAATVGNPPELLDVDVSQLARTVARETPGASAEAVTDHPSSMTRVTIRRRQCTVRRALRWPMRASSQFEASHSELRAGSSPDVNNSAGYII